MRLYHGTHNNLMGTGTAHEGMCWTEEENSAEAYAAGGSVYELDMSGLNIVEVAGYDRDENEAPADADAVRAELAASGADVLVYADEDEFGREHQCYRLVSAKAVAQAAANMREV